MESRSYAPTLDHLVGDPAAFREKYFNRRPGLFRGVLSERAHDVLNLGDLDELLRLRAIRAPYVRAAKDGSSVREANFTCRLEVQNEIITDAIDADRIYDLIRGGATVTWSSLNHVRSNLRRMCEDVGRALHTESDVIAFLTPAQRQGFSPHHDPVDVLVVQLAGSKTWRYWDTPARRRPDVGHYTMAELGPPEACEVLQPGDVLYLPFGTPHVATAEDRMSLHISITIKPWTWADVMNRLVAEIIDDDPGFWAPVELTAAPAGEQLQDFARMTQLLAAKVSGADVAATWPRLAEAARPVPAVRDTIADMAAIDALTADSVIGGSASTKLSFGAVEDGRVPVTVRPVRLGYRQQTRVGAAAESVLRLPPVIAAALQRLAAGEELTVRECGLGRDPAQVVDAIRKLARAGIVVLR